MASYLVVVTISPDTTLVGQFLLLLVDDGEDMSRNTLTLDKIQITLLKASIWSAMRIVHGCFDQYQLMVF
jgi:hypothetical protein